jgi:glycosyltransferase involved in cell wall biosynthesis
LRRRKRFKGWVELRLAVVSPFLDRQHGTELCIIEQIERFANQEHWRIELYSQEVSQLSGICPASGISRDATESILWHKVSGIPGPHLLKYLWWFFANQWQRWRDRRSGRVRPDLLYSPGINCLDADVVVVHIVFRAFYERVRPELSLRRVPIRGWLRVIHRRLYYKLIMCLERRIYRDPGVQLVAVSSLVAGQLRSHFQREDVRVIRNAVDTLRFAPEGRLAKRKASRESASYDENDFVLLLIGNDWKKKGLDTLLEALAVLRDLPWRLLVVGSDDPNLYRVLLERLAAPDRVRFEKPSADVLSFYAAADLYAGPSLEDAFNLPILEAMACGLPVIASVQAGASEMIRDEETGFILSDPQDHLGLAQLIRRIYSDQPLRLAMGEAASRHVLKNCTWDRNAAETRELLEATLGRLHLSPSG